MPNKNELTSKSSSHNSPWTHFFSFLDDKEQRYDAKWIFDHFKNYVLAYVIWSAGLIALGIQSPQSRGLGDYLFGGAILVLAFALYILNLGLLVRAAYVLGKADRPLYSATLLVLAGLNFVLTYLIVGGRIIHEGLQIYPR